MYTNCGHTPVDGRDTERTILVRMNTMKENGMTTRGVAGDACITEISQFMRENGWMTRGMDKGC